MQDYTVFYQREQSGDYLVSVPALGWNDCAPTRAAAQEKIEARFKAAQQADKNVEEDSEVLRLSGPDHMTVDVLKMSNTDQVTASVIGEFQYRQEAWRRGSWGEQKRAKRKQEQKAEQKEGGGGAGTSFLSFVKRYGGSELGGSRSRSRPNRAASPRWTSACRAPWTMKPGARYGRG